MMNAAALFSVKSEKNVITLEADDDAVALFALKQVIEQVLDVHVRGGLNCPVSDLPEWSRYVTAMSAYHQGLVSRGFIVPGEGITTG